MNVSEFFAFLKPTAPTLFWPCFNYFCFCHLQCNRCDILSSSKVQGKSGSTSLTSILFLNLLQSGFCPYFFALSIITNNILFIIPIGTSLWKGLEAYREDQNASNIDTYFSSMKVKLYGSLRNTGSKSYVNHVQSSVSWAHQPPTNIYGTLQWMPAEF